MDTRRLFFDAMRACAEAHGCEFRDWSRDDRQVALTSESVPTFADVGSICRAVFGDDSMVESGWGHTTVYLDEAPFLEKPDMMLLHSALPYGTVLPEERRAKASETFRRLEGAGKDSPSVKHKR